MTAATETALAGRCAIHAQRPAFCRVWPTPQSWRPLSCTYSFAPDGVRQGECDSSACGVLNCCNVRRIDGEPEGRVDPSGSPCRHLIGLESHSSPSHPRVTASAMWIGDAYLGRTQAGWDVGRVRWGIVRWTVSMSNDQLWSYSTPRGLTMQLAPPSQEPLAIHLNQAEVAALRRLHPKGD